MVEIGDLLLRQCRLRVEIAHIESSLNVVLDPRSGIGDDPHCAGHTALARRTQPDTGAAIDDQQPAVGVPPDCALQRVKLVMGQEILRTLPDQRRLDDMRISVERRKILGHRREALNGHEASPHPMVTQCANLRASPAAPS
jgi:hypothetical protein